MPIVAWYVLSNVSYMNLQRLSICSRLRIVELVSHLVMRDVFPTLWSPRRTILLRFRGGDEKSAVTGDDAIAYVPAECSEE